jgi:glycerol transport system ATP-binding protein
VLSVRLEGVGLDVGDEVHLAEVELELDPGSMTVLLGPARAGKTSLLRLLAGLEVPTTGRVLQDDREMHRVPARQRNIGFVHQQFVNYPGKTVYENIAAPLRLAGAAANGSGGLDAFDGLDTRVREVAATLHLESLLERHPTELSGGQQQRTALARALVRDGALLLLDEPLVNLDYKLREELRQELRAVFARRGATVVYATSDPAEALLLGGRTVVLDEGRVLQQGDALEVYRRPLQARVGELTSVPPMNLIVGRVEAGRMHVGGAAPVPLAAHLQNLAAGTYRLGIRPHRLSVDAAEAGALRLRGTVEFAEISGSETFLHVSLTELGAECVIHRAGTEPHLPGEDIEVFFQPDAVFAYFEDGRLAAAPEPRD